MNDARVNAKVRRIREQLRAVRRAMSAVWERLQDGAVMEWGEDEPIPPVERAKTPPRLLTLRDHERAESHRVPPMLTPRTGLRLIARERLLRAAGNLEGDGEET